MIKIKDDFDLDKLIGFRRSENVGYYEFEDEDVFSNGMKILITPTREIFIDIADAPCGASSEEIPSMLYNLFKMGIIEEVRSE